MQSFIVRAMIKAADLRGMGGNRWAAQDKIREQLSQVPEAFRSRGEISAALDDVTARINAARRGGVRGKDMYQYVLNNATMGDGGPIPASNRGTKAMKAIERTMRKHNMSEAPGSLESLQKRQRAFTGKMKQQMAAPKAGYQNFYEEMLNMARTHPAGFDKTINWLPRDVPQLGPQFQRVTRNYHKAKNRQAPKSAPKEQPKAAPPPARSQSAPRPSVVPSGGPDQMLRAVGLPEPRAGKAMSALRSPLAKALMGAATSAGIGYGGYRAMRQPPPAPEKSWLDKAKGLVGL